MADTSVLPIHLCIPNRANQASPGIENDLPSTLGLYCELPPAQCSSRLLSCPDLYNHKSHVFLPPLSPPLLPPPSLGPAHRTPTNYTRASSPSSPPWRPSTPRPGKAASSEARPTIGASPTPTGLHPSPRKPCSRAGRERLTTAPSPHCSGSLTAPAAPSRDTPTTGRGRRHPFNLFYTYIFFGRSN